jgi:hypothetical protein
MFSSTILYTMYIQSKTHSLMEWLRSIPFFFIFPQFELNTWIKVCWFYKVYYINWIKRCLSPLRNIHSLFPQFSVTHTKLRLIKYTLENIGGAFKNGQSSDTSNIGYTRHRTKTRKRKKGQHNNLKRWATPTTPKNGGEFHVLTNGKLFLLS